MMAVVGMAYQSIGEARDLRTYAPPGELVDVGGHRLHIHCTGEPSSTDTPTVVMDSGLGGGSLDWVWVQPEVAKFARACVYDRAGYAWSDPGPMPRDSRQVAAELHTLLSNAGVPPPYVLVGQSFGGLNSRLYAIQHPDEIAGVVLVDASPDHLYDAFPPTLDEYQADLDKGSLFLFRTLTFLSRHGAMRIFVQLAGTEFLTFLEDYPPELDSTILAMVFNRTQYYETVVDELATFKESTMQIQGSGSDPNVPYIVMVRGLVGDETVSSEMEQQFEIVWRRLQVELAESLPDATLVVAEESDHIIHFCQPDLVVDAIRQIVEHEQEESL
ncbi:MAG: alpha/beta hydrolase [Chloroflexi bacterium]|nr:alpha/beta hydrolase [Chloroflexota bacterium]